MVKNKKTNHFFTLFILYCCCIIALAESAMNNKNNEAQLNALINEAVFNKQENEQYLKLDKQGIKVYIYKTKNSEISAFKALAYINSPIDSIMAVLSDNKSCAEWVHECAEAYIVKDISFNERYHYQVVDIPFPFKDRDLILYSILQHDPVSKIITIKMYSAADYCENKRSKKCRVINQSDRVRINRSLGMYKLEAYKNGTAITWIQHTDPTGNLPGFLVNGFVKDTPYWTLKNLAEKTQEEKYKYAQLVYDTNGVAIALNMNGKR